jgi:twitching motility two-component system response regulator PilH
MATVLVCDDQPALRDLMRAALADSDHEVVEVADPFEALRLAKELRPEVVILDVVLPGRSGLDVLADLRRDPALAETRVVLCSAGMRNVDRRVVESLAADRYLPKPFSPRELAEVVEELLAA